MGDVISKAAVIAVMRQPFLQVFLDGRNEYGSHVLPMPGDTIGDLDQIQSLLQDQDEGLAERIISEAEALGHEIGQGVVTTWSYDNDGGFEYVRIDPLLTEFLSGTPAEQRAALAKAMAADPYHG